MNLPLDLHLDDRVTLYTAVGTFTGIVQEAPEGVVALVLLAPAPTNRWLFVRAEAVVAIRQDK